MDINTFYELRSRLYLTAAAGCAAVNDDFRLKRAVEAFEPLSQANKAFGQLYARCSRLFAGGDTAEKLADCIALADALAVTQGTFADKCSETEPLKPMKCIPVNASYSAVNEVCAAVSGCKALTEEQVRYLSDPRAAAAFVSFAEKGRVNDNSAGDDLARAMYRIFGDGITEKLKAVTCLTDEKTSSLPVRYVSLCAGEKENDWYLSLAQNENAPKKIRAKAVEALACSQDNTETLVMLYQTEKGDVKNAALMSLAKLSPPEAEPIFAKLIEKYKDSYKPYISVSRYRICGDFAKCKIDEEIRQYKTDKKFRYDMFSMPLLINKTDTAETFIRLSELMPSDQLNSFLCTNFLYENRSQENDRLICGLHERCPEYFKNVWSAYLFCTSPESAITSADDIGVLKTLKYNAVLGEYYFNVGTAVFKSIPESILQMLSDTDPIAQPKFNIFTSSEKKKETEEKRMNYARNISMIFYHLVSHCSEADMERVVTAANKFAWCAVRDCPNIAALHLLMKTKAPGNYNGVISRCAINDIDHVEFAVLKYLEEVIPSVNDRKSEAQAILSELQKIKKDMRYNLLITYFENYIKKLD